ncbi:hypothetical protein BG55_01990 [Erwinia mallotivora]|uniref:Uncharacterized protein n=1 Tax=Erwinia mallotivora TaxID=69222 RepID=A0A014NTN9_9GAMM|nr:hypothetical protein BG55_01990 [Erwinia mallotivora]
MQAIHLAHCTADVTPDDVNNRIIPQVVEALSQALFQEINEGRNIWSRHYSSRKKEVTGRSLSIFTDVKTENILLVHIGES